VEEVEAYREWRPEAVMGIRNTRGWIDICVQYPGWPSPLWMDVSNQMGMWKKVRQFMKFQKVGGKKVEDIFSGKVNKANFCLAGCAVDGPDYGSEEPGELEKWAPKALVAAKQRMTRLQERYAEDKGKNRFYGGKALLAYGRLTKKVKELDELEDDENDGADEDTAEPSAKKKKTGKGKVTKKKGGSPVKRWVERDADRNVEVEDEVADSSDIQVDRLPGAKVSVFWDNYGWVKGVVVKANGHKCTIKYNDDGSTEEVELPDDTIKIDEYA